MRRFETVVRAGARPLLLVVAAIVMMLPIPAAAQSVAGVVRDASGAVLPGVSIEAASPALIEKVRTAVSDGAGQYRLENLTPGIYKITYTLPGFTTFERDRVQRCAKSSSREPRTEPEHEQRTPEPRSVNDRDLYSTQLNSVEGCTGDLSGTRAVSQDPAGACADRGNR